MNRKELTLLGLMRRRAEIAEERLREANLEPSRPMQSIHNYVRDLAIKHGVDPDALPPAEEHNDPAEEIDRMLLAGPEGGVQQPTKERAPWRFQRTRGIPEKKEQGGDEAAGRHAPAGDGR